MPKINRYVDISTVDREAKKDGARPTAELTKNLRASVGLRGKPPGTKPVAPQPVAQRL